MFGRGLDERKGTGENRKEDEERTYDIVMDRKINKEPVRSENTTIPV